jgi:hypothetical protein
MSTHSRPAVTVILGAPATAGTAAPAGMVSVARLGMACLKSISEAVWP